MQILLPRPRKIARLPLPIARLALRMPFVPGLGAASGGGASPSWYTSIASGDWGTLPVGTLTASGLDLSGGQVIDQYSGMVINTVGIYVGSTFIPGTFPIFWGGGHAVYGGNEVYAVGPLESDSQAWYRLRDPTSPEPTNVGEDGSGNPVARHTYSSIVHIPGARNWMFSAGGLARYTDAGGTNFTHTFDFNQVSPNSNMPWSKKADAPQGAGDCAAYDSITGKVWSTGAGNSVQCYDVAGNSWISATYKSPAHGSGGATAIDTTRGIWAMFGASGLRFYRTDDADDASLDDRDYYAPSTTGTPASPLLGMLYDPVADCFVFWDGNGKTVKRLTPPATNPYEGGNAWVWSSNTPSGGATPTSANAQGTYGRFGYSPVAAIRGYVLLNRAGDSIYFHKP